MFSIYVNNISYALKYSSLVQFADDTTIYITGDVATCLNRLNSDLCNIFEWFCCNRLSLSVAKSKAIFLHKLTQVAPDLSHRLSIGGQAIPFENCINMLGLHIDSSLVWERHISHVCSKLSRALFVMNRCKHFLNPHTMKLMYYGLIFPHINYGISLWAPAASSNSIKRIERIQKKALHAVHFS